MGDLPATQMLSFLPIPFYIVDLFLKVWRSSCPLDSQSLYLELPLLFLSGFHSHDTIVKKLWRIWVFRLLCSTFKLPSFMDSGKKHDFWVKDEGWFILFYSKGSGPNIRILYLFLKLQTPWDDVKRVVLLQKNLSLGNLNFLYWPFKQKCPLL
jgi:hypothetical protein